MSNHHYARLEATELQNAELSGLDFRGANLQLCSFAGADLTGAVWDDARGELFDELEELREKAATFDEVDAERAKQEERADKLEIERDELDVTVSELREHVQDLEARLADAEAAREVTP